MGARDCRRTLSVCPCNEVTTQERPTAKGKEARTLAFSGIQLESKIKIRVDGPDFGRKGQIFPLMGISTIHPSLGRLWQKNQPP